MWPDLAKFCQFGIFLKSLRQFLKSSFSDLQNFEPTLQMFYGFRQFSIIVSGEILKKYLAICSHRNLPTCINSYANPSVWPVRVIFESSWWKCFGKKVARDFLAILKNINCKEKLIWKLFGNFWKSLGYFLLQHLVRLTPHGALKKKEMKTHIGPIVNQIG